MKYKTSELEGVMLDAAVAKALGYVYLDGQKIAPPHSPSPSERARLLMSPALTIDDKSEWFEPSSCWALGGPIIERERIGVLPATKQVKGDRNYYRRTGRHLMNEHDGWVAGYEPITHIEFDWGGSSEVGETPLIAAMRAFVASKLGDEVEL